MRVGDPVSYCYAYCRVRKPCVRFNRDGYDSIFWFLLWRELSVGTDCFKPVGVVRADEAPMVEIRHIPSWSWLFVFLCGTMLIITGSTLSVLQGLVGVVGAVLCLLLARDYSKSTASRMLLCASVMAVSWLVFAALAISKLAIA